MSLSSIPRQLRISVAARDEGRCRYCRLRQVGQGAVFHVDHIVPRSRRGTTSAENLALQCPHCSLHKSSKIQAADPDTHSIVALFHPLQDEWTKHFQLEINGTITGLTATGRATVGALQMNAPLVKAARAMQRLLGIV